MGTVDRILEESRREMDANFEELWRPHDSAQPDHIFHYTSIDGLLGILTQRKFFASDMLAGCDRSEFRYGADLVAEVLRETAKDDLIDALLDSITREAGAIGAGTRYFVYGVCFCCEDDVLTQWREYGSGGGFAIGLDFKKVVARALQTDFTVARMLYDRSAQKDIIGTIVAFALKRFEVYAPALRRESNEDFKRGLDGFLLNVGMSLLSSVLRMKHPAFHSEDEWRILRIETHDANEQPKFRARNNVITPYIELPFAPDAVTKVQRSPGLWPSANEYAVRRLVNTLGGHVTVGQSSLPI